MVPEELTGGYIFDIQGFSVHDGPGCRTLVFLKGCSLCCKWCSNPEGINPFPELLYNSSKCLHDELCLQACFEKAISSKENTLIIDRILCHQCSTYECEKACCSSALRIGGYFIDTDELLRKIQRDRHYWGNSGGITLTGGEPFLQAGFAHDILKRCFDSYIHTAVETCGNVPWENIERSLDFTDWIFYDLKQLDSVKHQFATGAGNELILENACKLAERFKGRLVFRMPFIPGFNDDEEQIHQVSDFLHDIHKDEINILPVHHLGREKYALLGMDYYTTEYPIPSKESLERIKTRFIANGIRCYEGSDTPF